MRILVFSLYFQPDPTGTGLILGELTRDLAKLAELLAAPIVLDAQVDRDGTCYQRATRHFGRVRIEAFAEGSDGLSPPLAGNAPGDVIT